MDFYTFIQWCFRDGDATIITLMVLGMVFSFIVKVIRVITHNPVCDCEEEEDD
jgi:hypothetical protein